MTVWKTIDSAPKEEWINVILIARDKGKRCVMPAVFDGREWRALTICGLQTFLHPTHWTELPPPPDNTDV